MRQTYLTAAEREVALRIEAKEQISIKDCAPFPHNSCTYENNQLAVAKESRH
jgi:hypothetical protein